MGELRSEEKVVAATVAATLGLVVEQYDDGSQPGMHDLNILATDGTSAALEVTAAVDAESLQLWKLVNGQDERWIVPSIRGGWLLHLEPNARAKRLLKEAPGFLQELEAAGIDQIAGHRRRGEAPAESVETQARSLGIVSGNQSATDFAGSIYLTIEQPTERTGGLVDSAGSAVPTWVRDFLLHPHQSDVLGKLQRADTEERHVFILVPALSTAPFGVTDMLWRDEDDLVPTGAPDLPEQVTHVWLMTFWTVGSGLRWSAERGWERFERHFQLPHEQDAPGAQAPQG